MGLDISCVAEQLIGKTVHEAKSLLSGGHGILSTSDKVSDIRVVNLDGEELCYTTDYKPDRVNVRTDAGKITNVISVG